MKTFFSLLFVASTLTAMACSSSDGDTSPDASPDASADATPAPDAALPTCAAKGGSCTALVPGACANGTVDSAVSDCGAGQVGAACCIPNAKPSCASLGGTCAPVAPGACAGTVEPRGDCGGGGRPEEVAAAVSFLLSRDAAYVTRQVLSVNGGLG